MHSTELFRTQSAFYRPTPTKVRLHHTTTPYSDALKAAAVLPRPHLDTSPDLMASSELLTSSPELLSPPSKFITSTELLTPRLLSTELLAPDLLATPDLLGQLGPIRTPHLGPLPPPFWLHGLPHNRLSPDPIMSSSQLPFYPIIYKPKILTTPGSPVPVSADSDQHESIKT